MGPPRWLPGEPALLSEPAWSLAIIGEGTFDVSILTFDEGSVFEVRGTAGGCACGHPV